MSDTLPPDIADALAAWVRKLPESRSSLDEAGALALRAC